MNQQHYDEIKEFALHYLSHRPWCPAYTGTPMTHIEFILETIADALKEEDYEMAQALKDAVIQFVNEHWGEQVTKETMFKIPEWKERDPINGIICPEPGPGDWGYIPPEFSK